MRIAVTVIRNWLLGLFLFLLPWQTQWIIRPAEIGGAPWEYGTLVLYATEILLLVVIIMDWKNSIQQFVRLGEWKWMVVIGAALLTISAAFAQEPGVAFFRALHLGETIFLVAVLANSARNTLPFFCGAFVAGVVLQAALGIFQIAVQWVHPSTILGIALHDPMVAGTVVVETAGGRFLRAYGGLPHPNILGGYLTVAILVFISLLQGVRSRTLWMVMLASSAILSGALFLTFSRSAWIALGVGIIGTVLITHVRGKSELRDPVVRWRIGSLALAAICILAAFGFAFQDVVAARWSGRGRLETISREERLGGVRDAWGLIRARPIVGWGVGMFTRASADRNPGQPAWAYQPVHSVSLLILAELGALGMFFLLIALFGLWRFIVRWWYASSSGPWIRGAALSGALLSILIIALFEHYPWSLYSGNLLASATLGFLLNQAKHTP